MKDKTTAGLLAIFLGAWGAQYWYLEQKEKATKYLLISLLTFGVGATVISIIGIIDGIKFLSMTDDEFNAFAGNTIQPQQYQQQPQQYQQQPQQYQQPRQQYQQQPQQNYYQPQQYAAPSSSAGDTLETLKKYKGLLDAGAITQAEYDQLKAKLLRG